MTTLTPAFVVLNPRARHGLASRRWLGLRPLLAREYALETVTLDAAGDWLGPLAAALARGTRLFLAAGGDGTVHALINALGLTRGNLGWRELCLGAVGLGSSNDFHKPFARREGGVPLRIDRASARPRDLGQVSYEDERGQPSSRLFVVSASVGATAGANRFFNDGDRVLRWLKPRSLGLAIGYAALRTLRHHRPLRLAVGVDRQWHDLTVDNLSVTKTPFLAGSLRYDTPVAPADGRFAVNLCEHTGRHGVGRMLLGLARGRFLGLPGARHWSTAVVEIDGERSFDLELDGELVRARRVRFEILSEQPRICA